MPPEPTGIPDPDDDTVIRDDLFSHMTWFETNKYHRPAVGIKTHCFIVCYYYWYAAAWLPR